MSGTFSTLRSVGLSVFAGMISDIAKTLKDRMHCMHVGVRFLSVAEDRKSSAKGLYGQRQRKLIEERRVLE